MIEAYIFSPKWPKLPESCSEYPSQTNWIWQLFGETMLPPLPGGCARAAIASAPASIMKCYFFDHSHTWRFLNISAFYMFNMESRHLLNLSVQNALDFISMDFNVKHFPGGVCARNSLEQCVVRCPYGRYRAHIATVYYISRPPSITRSSVHPCKLYLKPSLLQKTTFITFSVYLRWLTSISY